MVIAGVPVVEAHEKLLLWPGVQPRRGQFAGSPAMIRAAQADGVGQGRKGCAFMLHSLANARQSRMDA